MTEYSEASSRSAAQIEADLAATRLELADTVNDLVEQLQPSHLLEMAKDDLGRRFDDAKQQAAMTIDAAREGDQDAMRKVGVAAAAAAGVVALVVWRLVRR